MLNKSLIQIFTKMIRPPPPIPWITLPAINMLMLMLTAAISDPTKNTILATRTTGFRPKISLIFPHDGVAAAAARRYADPIHVKSASLAWRTAEIVGRAVVTMV